MATLKLAIPKSGTPIFLIKYDMLSTIDAVAFLLIAVSCGLNHNRMKEHKNNNCKIS